MEIVVSVIGTLAGIAAVAIALLQLRRTPQQSPAAPAPREDPAGRRVGSLGPPIGRLPEVRGRSDLVSELKAALQSRNGNFRVLAGLGGIGKTTIALSFAEEVQREGHRVWWISAVDQSALSDNFLELAQEVGATSSDVEEARAGRLNPADLLWTHLESITDWVLVIDNADDLDVLRLGSIAARDGTGWLRPSMSGLVMVTSRIADPVQWGRFAQIIKVHALEADQAAQILLDRAPHAGTRNEAVSLSERLGGLPLGLRQAGAFLASPFAEPSTFAGYQAALSSRFSELMGDAVHATWEISLDALAAQGAGYARQLLHVLACFAPSVDIPPNLLDQGILEQLVGPGKARVGLDSLLTLGLIESRSRGSVLVHPLVADANRVEATHDITEVAALLVAHGTQALTPDNPNDWSTWLDLLPHLRTLLVSMTLSFETTGLISLAKTADRAGSMLAQSGRNRESETLVRMALARVEPLDDEHPTKLSLRYRLADILRIQGQHQTAQPLFERTLEAQLRLFGPDHPSTLASQNSIAWTLAARGHLNEAEHRYRSVLETRIRILGPNHPDTLATRYNIAWTVATIGRLVEAEALLKDVFADRNRVIGADHPDTISTQHDIARTIATQGRHAEARALYNTTLGERSRILGPDHPDTVSTRHEIARIAAMQGDFTQSDTLFREVLSDRQRVLGPTHPGTMAARYAIAWTLALRDKNEEAETSFRDVLADQQRILGNDHPRTLATRNQIGLVLAKQRRYQQAESMLVSVLNDRRRILGAEHPDTQSTEEALRDTRARLN